MDEKEKEEIKRMKVERYGYMADKIGKWIVIGLVLGGFVKLDILKAILELLTK